MTYGQSLTCHSGCLIPWVHFTLHGVLDEWIETGVAPKWHTTKLYQLDGRAGKVTPMSPQGELSEWREDKALVSSIQTQMLSMFRDYGFVPEMLIGFSKALSTVEAHSNYRLEEVCSKELNHISDIEAKLIDDLQRGFNPDEALDISEFDDLEF